MFRVLNLVACELLNLVQLYLRTGAASFHFFSVLFKFSISFLVLVLVKSVLNLNLVSYSCAYIRWSRYCYYVHVLSLVRVRGVGFT
eukprot:SAG31_NODE_1216_length_9328_cov_12.252465_2_plen_86_part_00